MSNSSDSDKVDLLVSIATLLMAESTKTPSLRKVLRADGFSFQFIDLAAHVQTDLSKDTFRRFVHELSEKGLLKYLSGGGRRVPLIWGVADWHRLDEVQDPTAASEFLFSVPLPSVEELGMEVEEPVPEAPEQSPTDSHEGDPAAELGQYFMQLVAGMKAVESTVRGVEGRLASLEKQFEDLSAGVDKRCDLAESQYETLQQQRELKAQALVKTIEDSALLILEAVKDVKPLPLQEFAERVEKALSAPPTLPKVFEDKIHFLINRFEKADESRAKSDAKREEMNAQRDTMVNALINSFGHWMKKTDELATRMGDATMLGALLETALTVKEFMQRIDHIRVGGATYYAKIPKNEVRQVKSPVPEREPAGLGNIITAVYDPTK